MSLPIPDPDRPEEGAGPLGAEARRRRIHRLVAEHGFATVEELARRFGVSAMTIRRDLERLARDGLIHRTHGGAVARRGTDAVALELDEPSFRARARRHAAAKAAIAEAARALVAPGATIGLDVGTTTFELARRLADREDVRVFTNSLRAASVLGQGRAEIYLPGGRVRRGELSLVGSLAARELARYWLDVAFVGIAGLTQDGCFEYSPEDNEIKQVYLARARRVVVLCDSSKFGRMSVVRVCDLERIDVLISEAEPPPALAAALARAGVELRLARPAAPEGE